MWVACGNEHRDDNDHVCANGCNCDDECTDDCIDNCDNNCYGDCSKMVLSRMRTVVMMVTIAKRMVTAMITAKRSVVLIGSAPYLGIHRYPTKPWFEASVRTHVQSFRGSLQQLVAQCQKPHTTLQVLQVHPTHTRRTIPRLLHIQECGSSWQLGPVQLPVSQRNWKLAKSMDTVHVVARSPQHAYRNQLIQSAIPSQHRLTDITAVATHQLLKKHLVGYFPSTKGTLTILIIRKSKRAARSTRNTVASGNISGLRG